MPRYAIYYAPEAGPFADFSAAWLGWDAARGLAPPCLAIAGLPATAESITAQARRYGFHGTIKAPFRLHSGGTEGALHAACREMAQSLAPVALTGLSLHALSGFLALVPTGTTTALSRLAEQVMLALETFRAPLTAPEIASRRPESLTPRQRDLLDRYGYPYVLEEFQFHLTLTGALSHSDLAATKAALAPHLMPLLPRPFIIRDLCLCGEAEDGLFRILHRYALTG